jgi:hypothetical protein
MNIPQKMGALGTQDTGQRQKNTQKTKKMSNTHPTKKPMMSSSARL